ncbi:MAG: hypothetical protein KDD35_11635 [Bdellovibrionales bacterium]|nr:hypothetical protein [Bdellovibrionales bacterium]
MTKITSNRLGITILSLALLLESFLFSPQAICAATSKNDNILFEGAIGTPSTEIKNPDDSSAYYSGLALQGRILFPIYSLQSFASQFSANLRYLELENTANNALQKEFSGQLGPGIGLRLSFGKIIFGADYFLLIDKHYSFGSISKELSQEFTPISYYAGISMPIGTLSFGLTYTLSSGSIGTKQTLLNQNSAYNDTLIMLHINWNTGISFGKFAKDLFKL